MNGWVTINRSLMDNWLWKDKPFSKGQAWIDLIMLCNHEDKKVPHGNKIITVKRGQHLTSLVKLADRWGWDRNKVSRFLNVLESDSMLNQKRTSKDTTVTLVNYDKYQCGEHQNEHEMNIKCASDEHQMNTNNNEKNDNNENNNKKNSRFTPPSLDEVKAYCLKKGYQLDAQYFIDFYESKGWMVGKNKMTNWKAAVSGWNSREKKRVPKKSNFNNFSERQYDMGTLEEQLIK